MIVPSPLLIEDLILCFGTPGASDPPMLPPSPGSDPLMWPWGSDHGMWPPSRVTEHFVVALSQADQFLWSIPWRIDSHTAAPFMGQSMKNVHMVATLPKNYNSYSLDLL